MALAIALLPFHASFAKPVLEPMAAMGDVGDPGDCHGKKVPDRPDLGGAACQHCGACHAVQTVPAEPLVLPGHAATPIAVLLLILQGTTPQPNLHPPLG